MLFGRLQKLFLFVSVLNLDTIVSITIQKSLLLLLSILPNINTMRILPCAHEFGTCARIKFGRNIDEQSQAIQQNAQCATYDNNAVMEFFCFRFDLIVPHDRKTAAATTTMYTIWMKSNIADKRNVLAIFAQQIKIQQ